MELKLEIVYVYGGKARGKAGKAEGPTYRNRKREANIFGEVRESRSSPPPASESQDGGATCFESSVSHFFEKCLLLQATGIVAFKIVLTYLSWNIEVKQSN